MSPRKAWGIVFGLVSLLGLAAVLGKLSPPSSPSASLPSDTLSPPTCDESKMEIGKLKARTEYGYVHVTGTLTNHCSMGIGAQLKFTAYGADGDVVTSSDFWPDSVSNVPANSIFPFEWVQPVGPFKTYTVSVISTHRW